MIAIGLLFVRMLCDCFKPRRRLEAEILPNGTPEPTINVDTPAEQKGTAADEKPSARQLACQ
jgi:hypothetical protein